MLASLIKRLGARQAPGTGLPGIKLSVNDPRWGHRLENGRKNQEGRRPNKDDDNDGPPELAELWRDFNARLNRLLGKREGGGGGPYRPDSRGVGIGVAVVAGVAVLIWLSSGAFVVQDGQVGIVTTFGRPAYTAAPGFNWRWPAPFQAHALVDVAKVQSAEIGYRNNVRNKQPAEALMLTGDQNLVDVQFSVQYRIKDPAAWLFANRDQVDTLRGASESVVRGLIGAGKMDEVLTRQNRDRIAADAARRIQVLADRYGLGVGVVGVTMQSVAPPDAVAAAFADTVKAQEEGARERSDAQTYATDVVAQAKAKAAHQIQDAEANRAKAVDTAAGEAARFDQVAAEYAKAPGVTRDRMYLDTMQQIFSSTSKIMIDAKTPTTVNLPLDRMVAQVAANEAAIGSHSGPVMPPVQPAQAGQQDQAVQPQPSQGQASPPAQSSPPAQQPAQQTAQPIQATPAPQPQSESVRQRDPRSRENARERESR